jgi:hypothetical protein
MSRAMPHYAEWLDQLYEQVQAERQEAIGHILAAMANPTMILTADLIEAARLLHKDAYAGNRSPDGDTEE